VSSPLSPFGLLLDGEVAYGRSGSRAAWPGHLCSAENMLHCGEKDMTERAPEHPPVMPIRCKIWRIPRAGLDEREAGGAALLSQPPRPL